MTCGFVFPGQGTQHVGMGRHLLHHHPVAREVFDRASRQLDDDVAERCLRGDPETLTLTLHAQPAIFVTNAAALAVLAEAGIRPDLTAGHSVGEISALHAAGAFDFETALAVVQRRAELMAGITANGGMVAVLGLDEAALADVCAARGSLGLVIGLHNGPEHFVLSGSVAAIEAAVPRCRDLGALRVTRLRTQHAFHSPLMEPAVAAWEAFVDTVPITEPRIPVALNTTGELATGSRDIRRAIVDQIAHRVRWAECVARLVERGATLIVESGDSKALTALARSSFPDVTAVSMSDPKALRRLQATIPEGGSSVAVP